jgi:hypothetical protein
VNRTLYQTHSRSLADDPRTAKKLAFNYRKNKEQDHTARMDEAVRGFVYDDCKGELWQDETHSLLHGTPLWDGASASQRLLLNHLYWVAYYAQIVSAEIATILLNQTAAAGLSTIEDFRVVGDTLDLETTQERAHIEAFKTIGEAVEAQVFGERLFTYPMRSMFTETMLFAHRTRVQTAWRTLQLRAFTLLSAGSAFIGGQYFTVRGLRTLNGKMVQQALAQHVIRHPDPERTPVPARVSYYHFMDESFHFASSCLLSRDLLASLPPPTAFERWVANRAIEGCQKDHRHFSIAVRGLFWHDPALFPVIERLLRSPVFGMAPREAREMLRRCFTEETEALHAGHRLHRTAVESYRAFVDPLPHVTPANRAMGLMAASTLPGYLAEARRGLARLPAVA